MSGLRAGGLAMIIGGHSEVMGQIVTTERIIRQGEIFTGPDGKRHRNPRGARWLITGERIKNQTRQGGYVEGFALIFSQHLMPIDPDEELTHERTEDYCHVYGH